MDSSNPYFYRLLGNVHLKNQAFLYAMSNYSKARELNKNNLASGLALIRLQLQLEMKENALSIAEELLDQSGQNKAVLRAHMKAAYKNKKYEACIQSAEALFDMNDSNLLVQKIVGIAYFHQKEYQKTIHLLEKVIEIEQESDILYYYLGISYRESKQYEKAQKALEQSIDYAISDNLESYYTQLAVSYEEAGNHVKAIHFYQAAYKSSRNQILLYHLARNYDTYYQDKSTALEYYERYLSSEDTANQLYQNYSKHRIEELKVGKHFELDTVN
jgi:tetratricopeptide (TPR) repeat protein